MNLPLRSVSGALALLAGLFGISACGGAVPAATPSVAVAGTSSAAPTTDAPSPAVVSSSALPSERSGQPAATSTAVPAGTATTPLAAPSSSAAVAASTSAPGSVQREVNPAGDIPDNQAFVPYVSSAGGFTVTVPEGWARTDTATGAVFTDKYNKIRVDTRRVTSAPTPAAVRASEVPALARSEANFVLGDVTTVTRKAGTAVLLTYQADTAPNEVTGKVATASFERYDFFKAGTEVSITVGGPVGGDNVDPWRTVTDSFSWSA